MNKKLLLTTLFCVCMSVISFAQPSRSGNTDVNDKLFLQEVPSAALHKSYYNIEPPTHVIMAGAQMITLSCPLLKDSYSVSPTVFYSRIQKMGVVAKLTWGSKLQSGMLGATFRVGKFFRPYVCAGFLFHKAYFVDDISTWTTDEMIEAGVHASHTYELFEANTYKYTFNPTGEIGGMFLFGRFAMQVGAGWSYNNYFPFYKNSIALNAAIGYTFGPGTK